MLHGCRRSLNAVLDGCVQVRLGRWGIVIFQIAGSREQTKTGGGWLLRVGKWRAAGSLAMSSSRRQTLMHTNSDQSQSHAETKTKRLPRGAAVISGESCTPQHLLGTVKINRHSLLLRCYGTKTLEGSSTCQWGFTGYKGWLQITWKDLQTFKDLFSGTQSICGDADRKATKWRPKIKCLCVETHVREQWLVQSCFRVRAV